MINLIPLIGHKDIYDLFSFCVYKPDKNKIESLYNVYENSNNKHLYGSTLDGRIVALIGISILSETSAEISHLAVAPKYRKRGLGKQIITDCKNTLNLGSFVVETDDDAVAFYKRIGFKVVKTELKHEKYTRYTLSFR